jgi:hypothetical protein
MEKKIAMGYVPLREYGDGQAALKRLETLKSFVIKSEYSISREEIASILGFELLDKELGHEEVS